MVRKIDQTLIDNLIDLINNGFTLKNASKIIGIHNSTAWRKLSEQGFIIPSVREKKSINMKVDEIKSMYQNGKSENAIAKHFNVGRSAIRNRLVKIGIIPRTQSEAEKLKWSQMDEEARLNQTKNAHDSVRGKIPDPSSVIKRAITREKIQYDHLLGFGEIEFREFLKNKRIDFIGQKAVGSYNIDIAIGNIAVELTVDRARFTRTNTRLKKRIKYLFESGYKSIYVIFDSVEILTECCNYIVSNINRIGALESFGSQYWMIRCRSENYSIFRDKLGKFSSKPSPIKLITECRMVDF